MAHIGECMESNSKTSNFDPANEVPIDYFRFHLPNLHHFAPFGNDWLALKAEAFASLAIPNRSARFNK
jgi:hypothetical protein